jgi:hypothetical protein
MEDEIQKSNSGLKALVVILSLALAGSIFYIYKTTTESKKLATKVVAIKSEKETVLDSLATLKSTYDKAIADKTQMSNELEIERQKVVDLMDNLTSSKGDAASMIKYRNQYNQLQVNMKALLAENEALKKQNQKLIVQRDSTGAVLDQQRKSNDTLKALNTNLATAVKIGSKLMVYNVSVTAIKDSGNGKESATEKASRTDKIKVCFTIAPNEIAKSEEKKYYIQIKNAKDEILGIRKTENFDGKTLVYSFLSNVVYLNKTIDVCEFLASNGKKFEKGIYYVNIYDRAELVSKKAIELK